MILRTRGFQKKIGCYKAIMSCAICIENMTASQTFECPFCEFSTCKKCVKRYILGSADDPNCMNCRRLLDRETLMNISKAFVNTDLKQHRETVLMERETSMMPSTQVYVDQELQRRANAKLLKSLREERKSLRAKLMELDRTCFELQRQTLPPLETERRQFVHRCAHEGCRGFLSTAWRCNVCERYTCSECNAPRGREREDDHVCNAADKETMQLLKNECKRCPGCAQFIQKVSGCDQMWCTSCHTAFSWRTGLKINGQIHNPHFYEFQRTNQGGVAREHGDIPCGGIPTYRELIDTLRSLRTTLVQADSDFLINAHRLTAHIDAVERPRFQTLQINEQSNLDLRISYILNEISRDRMKEKLQQREKKNEKKREIEMVLQMFVHTMGDLFRQGVLERFATIIPTMRALIDYVNTTMKSISRKYSCMVPNILSSQLRIVNVRG